MPIDLSPSAILAASKGVDLDSDVTPSINSQKPSKLFRFLPAVGQGADLASTFTGLNNGMHETNPLMQDKGTMIGLKSGMALGSYFAIKSLEKDHPKAARALSLAMTAGGLIPAGINLLRQK